MYYDLVVSLGQWCMASESLRRCHLQKESMPFDWSGGIIPKICGKGGLEVKVNLICNHFQDYLNLEDLENRGPDKDDLTHYWVVNTKTGLQYRHDFPNNIDISESYLEISNKYNRRIERLYNKIDENNKILFVFISDETEWNNDYLYKQAKKLINFFSNKKIDILYIIQDDLDPLDFHQTKLMSNVTRIDMNVSYSSHESEKVWLGNYDLLYPILKSYCFNPDSNLKEVIKNNKF